MKSIFLFSLSILLMLQVKAATISGTIKDSKNKAISYATILLLNSKDSSLVKGDVSNEQGRYSFDKVAAGTYMLQSSTIGYQKYYSEQITIDASSIQQDIVLASAERGTKEVKIVGKKPMIEVKADKTVFNVEQSINATGSNALELLRKSPGVQVDKDENISMRGKNNVLVYIDGKPTYLDSKDLAVMLKNTQSSEIESIELITNPSARYDAQGNAGIINIRLKKNKKFGTNGNVSLGASQGQYFKYNTSLSLNHRTKDINLFGNYSFSDGKGFNTQVIDREQNGQRFNFSSKNIDDNLAHSAKVGLDYYIDSKNIIGFVVNGMFVDALFKSNSSTFLGPVNNNYSQQLVASNRINGKRVNANINVNYKYEDTIGRVITLDVDYGNFSSSGASYQPNTYRSVDGTTIFSQSIFKNNTPTVINIFSIKSDYEQNFLKGKLALGIKSAYVKTDNDFQFYDVVQYIDTLNLNRTNHFVYNEFVNAAYVSYARTFNTKWSTQLGIRAEQTNSKGLLSSAHPQPDDTVTRSYINLFPSAGISYNLNAKNSFGISYSRRIDRPNYQDLNPFENKLDELTYEKGNAFLRPQYTNSFDLTHTYMQFFTTAFNYSHTKDMFMQTTDTTEITRTYVTQKNFASFDMFGLNISFPLPIRKWWMVYSNVSGNYNMLSANFEGRQLQNNYFVYSVYMDHTITLPKGFSFNVSGWYSGPQYWGGTFKMKPMGSIDLGLQKTLLSKKLTLKASVSDIFKGQGWRATSNFGGLYIRNAKGGFDSRRFNINLSYRFGNNQVAKQREHKSGATEESNRIKGK